MQKLYAVHKQHDLWQEALAHLHLELWSLLLGRGSTFLEATGLNELSSDCLKPENSHWSLICRELSRVPSGGHSLEFIPLFLGQPSVIVSEVSPSGLGSSSREKGKLITQQCLKERVAQRKQRGGGGRGEQGRPQTEEQDRWLQKYRSELKGTV